MAFLFYFSLLVILLIIFQVPNAISLAHYSPPFQSNFLPVKLKNLDRSSAEVQEFHVRQVPGDGSCMFHAVSAGLTYLKTNKHVTFDSEMREFSQKLRKISVDVLNSYNEPFEIDGRDINSQKLLSMAAESVNLTTTQYCFEMYGFLYSPSF